MVAVPRIRRILVLAANPVDTPRMRLDQEAKEIRESLKRSAQREDFEVVVQGATSTEDLRRALLEHEPHVLHFSGHG
ncbi:hypothetical protein IQ266_24610, partial [filamentous cyanobacterium LEGE 11480]|nr:hypothetical protein [Romeriopsis navalis LEGE 11480]